MEKTGPVTCIPCHYGAVDWMTEIEEAKASSEVETNRLREAGAKLERSYF
jgi:hypothetical protein